MLNKLLNEIVSDLVDTQLGIEQALLKTMVLARRTENQELARWVNCELKGYDTDSDLPEYRKFTGRVVGDFVQSNGFAYATTKGFEFNLNFLGPERVARIARMEFSQGISSLGSTLDQGEFPFVGKELPAPLRDLFQEWYRECGNPGLQILSLRVVIPATTIVEIVANVRSRLLDFILEIERKFGNEVDFSSLRKKEKDVNGIMKNIIINANGDGNVINTGKVKEMAPTINISKGDFEKLRTNLREIGLENADIEEITSILGEESLTYGGGEYGPRTKGWLKSMIAKAIDGAWNVSVGAAGNLLGTALQSFFGG